MGLMKLIMYDSVKSSIQSIKKKAAESEKVIEKPNEVPNMLKDVLHQAKENNDVLVKQLNNSMTHITNLMNQHTELVKEVLNIIGKSTGLKP